MNRDKLDLIKLQKALSVEAQGGFSDLQGNHYRFSEFLCLNLGKAPSLPQPSDRRRWQALAAEFADYPQLTLNQRQHLIAKTRQFLQSLQQTPASAPQRKQVKSPRTKPLQATAKTSCGDYQHRPMLEQSIAFLKGVGPKKFQYFERLGLQTVRDLLFYYPRDYLDYARQVTIAQLEPGETVTVFGTIVRCHCFNSPKNQKLTIFELLIRDRTGTLKLNRFWAGARFSHRGWQEGQKRRYPRGAVVAASGLVKQNKYGVTLDSPELEILDGPGAPIESLAIGRVLPVYPLGDGVPADVIRKALVRALPAAQQLRDPMPAQLRQHYELSKLPEAIANIHFPEDQAALSLARKRLIFDEFFYLQLGFLQRRQEQQQRQASAILAPTGELLDRFKTQLPFALTTAQQRVVNEILQDLHSETAMNRLIQGDVGSGKTVVAVFAILAAIQAGYQATLMAPTEVLAEQHYRKLVGWFNLLHLPVELLTGSTKAAKRREIHNVLATGELPLLVGTHALIQDPVQFQRLGLVVIDEQHRFGVQQRAQLLAKGQSPHVLSLTATPIPRTLALTLHGDLDVSQIDELPPGRQSIQTTVLAASDRLQAYDLIRREVAQGRQAYIILPLVEESEKINLRAATEEHKRLSEAVFPEFQVGLLHGRMSSVQKDEALTAFRQRKSPIIVSTTVIEVGVDVPNATVMLIEHAERFGLSQLHQLRGRVGRGEHKSYCLLMQGSQSAEAKQRLGTLVQSQDGFFIAEMDLRFRGPGEVLGTRQSGLPDFALASLVEDQEVLMLAREAAEGLIEEDKTLELWPLLQQELKIRYQRLLGGDILN